MNAHIPREELHLPKVGMRKIKSIIAVVTAFTIWQIIRLIVPMKLEVHPLFAYFYAIIDLRESVEKTKELGLLRIKATLIGLAIGLMGLPVSLNIAAHFGTISVYTALLDLALILVGILLTLWLAELLKCKTFCGIAAMIFVICIVRDRTTNINIYLYAILRVVQTLIGVFSAWIVNSNFRLPKRRKKMNLMGIDVGTTSVKTAIFNEKLEMLRSSNIDYKIESHGDIVEFESEKYWEIVKTELDGLDLKVDALAIDTQCETLILTDEDGNPVRKAIVWLDNRATKEAEIIEEHFGREKVYTVTGQPEITATWPACKLLWVKRNEPEVWAKTKKIFLLEDYLLYKLTGKFVTEKTLQSSTIYFDINNAVWWQEMLDFIGVDNEMLPTLCDSGKYVGDYKGIKVVTGAMDQVSGAIGAGIIKKGIVSEMTGTTMVIFSPCDTVPEFKADSIIPCHYNYDGKYCLLTWSSTAGMALKWFKNALCEDFSFKDLDVLAEKIPAGCDGLTFLPYLCGSTMPKYNPNARGSFTGLTPEHTRGHFVRSIMESISCILKENLDYLNMDVSEIRAMGGGANSPLWCQMKADMTNKTLVTLKNKETACLGGAILAGVGVGLFPTVESVSELIQIEKSYSPQGVDYNSAYENFQKADEILNI